MRHFIHCLFVLTLVLSLSQQTMAQNRVAVDKDGKIHKTLSKKNSQGTVDLSKILKPERDKTKKQVSKAKTSKTTAKKQESKPENIVEEKRNLPPRKKERNITPNRNTVIDSVAVYDYDEGGGSHDYTWPVDGAAIANSFDDNSFGDDEGVEAMEQYLINAVINSVLDNMVNVEGGTFEMGKTKEQGRDAKDNEKPKHKVTVSSFSISKYEVTQAQWMVIMGNNPSDDQDDLSKPVTNVSYRDVMEFIQKLNQKTGKTFRLPTEQEWEYAARGGSRIHGNVCYKYAGADNPSETAWTVYNSDRKTHSIGELFPNELGLYDMSGNVMEWCADRFQYYDSKHASDDYSFYSGDNYVCRGGSAVDDPIECRVSSRLSVGENEARAFLGFRLAM